MPLRKCQSVLKLCCDCTSASKRNINCRRPAKQQLAKKFQSNKVSAEARLDRLGCKVVYSTHSSKERVVDTMFRLAMSVMSACFAYRNARSNVRGGCVLSVDIWTYLYSVYNQHRILDHILNRKEKRERNLDVRGEKEEKSRKQENM